MILTKRTPTHPPTFTHEQCVPRHTHSYSNLSLQMIKGNNGKEKGIHLLNHSVAHTHTYQFNELKPTPPPTLHRNEKKKPLKRKKPNQRNNPPWSFKQKTAQNPTQPHKENEPPHHLHTKKTPKRLKKNHGKTEPDQPQPPQHTKLTINHIPNEKLSPYYPATQSRSK